MTKPSTDRNGGGVQFTHLDRTAGTTAWRQIELALIDDMQRGTLQSGCKLPSEAALAARFAVSKATVRRAIAELSAKRLLKVRNGLGAFVGQAAMRYPLDPHRFSENLIKAGRTPGLEVLAGYEREADLRVALALACQPGEKITSMLLLGTSDGSPMFVAEHCFPAGRFSAVPDEYREALSFAAVFGKYGLRVKRRSLVIRARPATADDRQHLLLALGATVIEVETLFVEQTGIVVDFAIARYPADSIDLYLNLE